MSKEKKEYTVIFNREQYLRHFDKTKTMQEEALKVALDTRKFEIELYWKRATYFWAFIAAAFAGFFALVSRTPEEGKIDIKYLLVVALIGWFFSLSWYLVNRGSKFWQENWERHVDYLEDSINGPLYKTVINPKEIGFCKLNNRYPISVSKINQLLSLIITLVWGYLVLDTFALIYKDINSSCIYLVGIPIMLIIVLLIVLLSKSNLPKEETEQIKFIMRK